jgi:hypothetical protein
MHAGSWRPSAKEEKVMNSFNTGDRWRDIIDIFWLKETAC